MYLHENRELFYEVVSNTAKMFHLPMQIIEKDYYVTMVLKLLTEKEPDSVLKGGTSLSKCFKAIERFSEDIDITFSEHIGEKRRKKLKYQTLYAIAEELKLVICNPDSIQSDRDYNCYIFAYKPITGTSESALYPGIRIETVLASLAFPTEKREVDNYIKEYLQNNNTEIITEYGLSPFQMKVQSIERTFIDKIFALCDYYMQGKSKRYSRHLYDIYKLSFRVKFDESLLSLISEVRNHRKTLGNCPSADDRVNISEIICEFCDTDFYRLDYLENTTYFLAENITYEMTVRKMYELVKNGYFGISELKRSKAFIV